MLYSIYIYTLWIVKHMSSRHTLIYDLFGALWKTAVSNHKSWRIYVLNGPALPNGCLGGPPNSVNSVKSVYIYRERLYNI